MSDLITQAVSQFNPSHVFVMFSGGDDSLAMASLAMEHPGAIAVHIDTGIGVWEGDGSDRRSVARKFVERTCKERGWPLLVYEAAKNKRGDGTPDPQIYEEMVMQFGFPGSNEVGHRKMYNRLKERPLRMLMREHGSRNQKVILVAGCRSQESERRMGNTKAVDQQGRTIWVNAIHDWSKDDCRSQINACGLCRNPCAINICKSGECMCGAFAKSGELNAELRHYYPEFVAWLHSLEKRVWEAGFPWRWDESPPQWFLDQKKGQGMLWQMAANEFGGEMPMCQSCIIDSKEGGGKNG